VTFDRRFIPEESLDEVRREVAEVVAAVEQEEEGSSFRIEDRMSVLPTRAPEGSPLTSALSTAIRRVRGCEAELVASPGTYDQKHVSRIAGVDHCVAYGPGPLKEAHQPDESCAVDDLVTSAQVMALAVLELVG
jgi:succinyl-diaminopimelate desuccinylase